VQHFDRQTPLALVPISGTIAGEIAP